MAWAYDEERREKAARYGNVQRPAGGLVLQKVGEVVAKDAFIEKNR